MIEKMGLKLDNHADTFYVIDELIYNGVEYYLLETESLGDEGPCIIIDESKNIIVEDAYPGFGELFDVLKQDWVSEHCYRCNDFTEHIVTNLEVPNEIKTRKCIQCYTITELTKEMELTLILKKMIKLEIDKYIIENGFIHEYEGDADTITDISYSSIYRELTKLHYLIDEVEIIGSEIFEEIEDEISEYPFKNYKSKFFQDENSTPISCFYNTDEGLLKCIKHCL